MTINQTTGSTTTRAVANIDELLHAAVGAGGVPNVVAIAADDDGVIYEGAAGPRDVGSADPITADSLLRVASMTKMVTTVAALQQIERGNLELDAPVDSYCPSFAELQVLDGFDAENPRLRAPARPATIRHLLTHTTGLGYWFWNADIARYEEVTGTPNVLSGSDAIFNAPMVADPGTTFEYGINTDWLGKAVEVASGQPLDAYLTQNVLRPLGMRQTTFLMSDEQRASAVPVHVRGEDGSWTATDLDWSQQPDWWAGGHGLYCTPRDYLAFQRMLLGAGTLGDARILEPATAGTMFSNQIGELDFPAAIPTIDPTITCDFNLGAGMKWGFGLVLNTAQRPGMRAAGSGGWSGAFNTFFWVDPTTRITAALYTQTLPFAEPQIMGLYEDFERALYAAL